MPVLNSTIGNIIVNSTSHAKSTSAVSPLQYGNIVLVIIGLIAVAVILFILRKYLPKPKLKGKPDNSHFDAIKKTLNVDMQLNHVKHSYLLLATGKYRITAIKKEIINNPKSKDLQQFYILFIRSGLIKNTIVFTKDLKHITKNNSEFYLNYKEVNFYAIGQIFLAEADIYNLIQNYLGEMNFRIHYQDLLNSLHKNRLKERIEESNLVADKMVLSDNATDNLLKVKEQLDKYQKI